MGFYKTSIGWALGLLFVVSTLMLQGGSASGEEFEFKTPDYDNPLSAGRLVTGSRNIRAAWFSDPVRTVGHSVLGGEEEASSLVVSTDKRVVLKLGLPMDSVFADREPRIVDIDGDGLDEIIVIRSYRSKGAVLAVVALRPAGLTIIAETEPQGLANTWINPAGVGDFDGDGLPDIALVRQPHDLGELEIYTLKGTRLERIVTAGDVSNHAVGKPDTLLSLVRDFDGDGAMDLAIPTRDRRMLQILTFKGRHVGELARYTLPARASENFAFTMRRGGEVMAIGVGGGRKHYIKLP